MEIETSVRDLIGIKENQRIVTIQVLDWLRVEFGVAILGKKRLAPLELEPETFILE